jgi:hypothetical protein
MCEQVTQAGLEGGWRTINFEFAPTTTDAHSSGQQQQRDLSRL